MALCVDILDRLQANLFLVVIKLGNGRLHPLLEIRKPSQHCGGEKADSGKAYCLTRKKNILILGST